jgi:hypothetical protein
VAIEYAKTELSHTKMVALFDRVAGIRLLNVGQHHSLEHGTRIPDRAKRFGRDQPTGARYRLLNRSYSILLIGPCPEGPRNCPWPALQLRRHLMVGPRIQPRQGITIRASTENYPSGPLTCMASRAHLTPGALRQKDGRGKVLIDRICGQHLLDVLLDGLELGVDIVFAPPATRRDGTRRSSAATSCLVIRAERSPAWQKPSPISL